MIANYKIFWVDDSVEWFESVQEQVTRYIEEQGLQPQIQFFKDGSSLSEYVHDDVDLFVLDYKLKGPNGDKLIQQLREAGVFTEVVLYSYDTDPSKVIEPLEGIFFCKRDDAADRIESVVDLTLHKLKDLAVVRGMVIASAIDLENMVNDLLVLLFKDQGDLFRRRIIEKHDLDAAKRIALLNGALKDYLKENNNLKNEIALRECKSVLSLLMNEVINERNILAHAKRTQEGNSVVLRALNKGEPIRFDQAWLATTRGAIAKHRNNLVTLDRCLRDEVEARQTEPSGE